MYKVVKKTWLTFVGILLKLFLCSDELKWSFFDWAFEKKAKQPDDGELPIKREEF